MKNSALPMKNGDLPIEIVDLPIINGDFPVRYVNVYQRVTYFWTKPFDGWLIVAYPLEIKHGWKKTAFSSRIFQ